MSHRAQEPSRAVAPHRRPPKEVTGKVTGEVSQTANHRAMHSDRTVAPYRRDPTVAPKVSNSPHPAYRAAVKEALWGRPAGATSRDLAEHEVQSQYVANEIDVQRAVSKSTSHHKFRNARAITGDGMVGEPPLHGAGWESALREHRAFDGAYGATTLESSHQTNPNELGKQRVVKGRESHAPSDGAVLFNETAAKAAWREKAAAAVGGGGGGAYRHEREFEGAAGLNSAERAQARNRERWASAEDRVRQGPKGAGMQPPTVFHPDGGVVYGGSARGGADHPTGGSSVPAAQRATREEYYKRVYEDTRGGKPAGVRNAHQAENAAASLNRVRARPDEVGEVRSAIGNGVKEVRESAYDGALGSTSRQINSALPELKASLIAGGEMAISAESHLASETGGGGECKTRFGADVPAVVFGEAAPPCPKSEEVKELRKGHAGADTHVVNRRALNARYHDHTAPNGQLSRYGRYGAMEGPPMDANSDTIGEALFSRVRAQDFDAGAGPLDAARGANRRLSGAAGASSSVISEGEPLLRYRARPDQTERQRATDEANAARARELHAAPQVEGVAFSGRPVSKLGSPRARGMLTVAQAGRGVGRRVARAPPAEPGPARGASPPGGSPASRRT